MLGALYPSVSFGWGEFLCQFWEWNSLLALPLEGDVPDIREPYISKSSWVGGAQKGLSFDFIAIVTKLG